MRLLAIVTIAALLGSGCAHRVPVAELSSETVRGQRVYWREAQATTFTAVDDAVVIGDAKMMRGTLAGYVNKPGHGVYALGSEVGRPVLLSPQPTDEVWAEMSPESAHTAKVVSIVAGAVAAALVIAGAVFVGVVTHNNTIVD